MGAGQQQEQSDKRVGSQAGRTGTYLMRDIQVREQGRAGVRSQVTRAI